MADLTPLPQQQNYNEKPAPHVLAILHRILFASFPHIHAKHLATLLAAVEAAVTGTLSDLARGLSGPVAVKHNIKRIEHLTP